MLQGTVSFEVFLPGLIPDDRFGKSLTFVAIPPSGGPRRTGEGRGDEYVAHRFHFEVEIDAPGDWRIDIEVRWPEGRLFASETLRIHDVP